MTISNKIRNFLKGLLVVLGFIIIIMPFIPAFKEYFLGGPEKEFNLKEVSISLIGVLIFTGGYYSNKMVDLLIKKFSK